MLDIAPRTRKRGTAAEKVGRDSRLIADRARGLGWTTLATRYGISARQCQKIWADRVPAAAPENFDQRAELRDELDCLDAAIAELAELAESTHNESVRLGAIKARLDAQSRRVDLKRLYGLLPLNVQQMQTESDLREIVAAVYSVFARHGIDDAVTREVADVLAGAEVNRPVLDGRSQRPLRAVAPRSVDQR